VTEREPVVALVVARGENGAIGKDGVLPWHLSTDLKFFRRVTLGKPIIMGRRTFESLGRPLDQRSNIVLTRDANFRPEGTIVEHSLAAALRRASAIAKNDGVDEIMVIGGDSVFREGLPLARRIYLTEVHASPPADVFLSGFDLAGWQELSREAHQAGLKDDYPFSFVVLERRGQEQPTA
jgi:dihydrofolate reductase